MAPPSWGAAGPETLALDPRKISKRETHIQLRGTPLDAGLAQNAGRTESHVPDERKVIHLLQVTAAAAYVKLDRLSPKSGGSLKSLLVAAAMLFAASALADPCPVDQCPPPESDGTVSGSEALAAGCEDAALCPVDQCNGNEDQTFWFIENGSAFFCTNSTTQDKFVRRDVGSCRDCRSDCCGHVGECCCDGGCQLTPGAPVLEGGGCVVKGPEVVGVSPSPLGTCGEGICQRNEFCGDFGLVECIPGAPSAEICNNGLDDDCDGDIDCEDAVDCLGWQPEDCSTNLDDNCSSGQNNFSSSSDHCGVADCIDFPEICDNNRDDDCDVATADTVTDECVPPLEDDEDVPEECDQCGACDARPVNLLSKQMFVGPHEDFRIRSPQGGSSDITFWRVYDSKRAVADQEHDAATGNVQLPYVRVMGPGWRHSFDVRLRLEGNANLTAAGDPEDPANPLSVTLETPREQVRMLYMAPGSYGRVPGSTIFAVRNAVAGTWTVTLDNGDVLEFVDPTAGATTALHPWGVDDPLETDARIDLQYHARLRYIMPAGATDYRLRLWYEQESTPPTGACLELINGANGCSASRGLLTMVVAEWKNVTWFAGSSIELKYDSVGAGTGNSKQQYLLKYIREGADRDDALAVKTRLADFTYVVPAAPNPTWRRALRNAATCVGHTSSGVDNSDVTCASETASVHWKYIMGTTDGVDGLAHLLQQVQSPVRFASGSPAVDFVDVELFTWVMDADGVPRVEYHASEGIDLAASSVDVNPNGTMVWQRNNVQNDVTFERGVPTNCSTGTCGHPFRPRVFARSIDDSRVALGLATSPLKDDNYALRRFDVGAGSTAFTADGLVLYESELVPSSSSAPTMAVAVSSGVETVTFTGVATGGVRRLTRSYYTSGIPRRLAAKVTLSPFGNGTTYRFPAETAVPSSWRGASTVSARAVPVHKLTLSGVTYYYDVDAFDADDDPNLANQEASDLNEAGERRLVWTHQTRTDDLLKIRYESSRTIFDLHGRVLEEREYSARPAIDAASAARALVARSTNQYTFTIAAGTKTRHRGRLSSTTRFTDLAPTTPVSFLEVQACAAVDAPYDELGVLVCSDRPQSPTNLRTKVTVTSLTTPAAGVRRISVQEKVGATILTDRYDDRLISGFNVESGTVGGVATQRFAAGTSVSPPLATSAMRVAIEKDIIQGTSTVLVRRESTYDPFGSMDKMEVYKGTESTPKRKTTFTFTAGDDQRKVDEVRRFWGTGASNYYASSTDYSSVSDQVTVTTEADNDQLKRNYSNGRLASEVINLVPVNAYTYTVDGHVATVSHDGVLVSTYAYAEGGRLVSETMNSARNIKRTYDTDLSTSTSASLGLVGKRLKIEKLFASGAGTPSRHLQTTFDNAGRSLVQRDMLASTDIVKRFYESKGSYAGTWNTEGTTSTGTQRTVTLSNNNQSGRLAYVTHPAGATFYEYDGLGRAAIEARYEATLPGSLTNTLTLQSLKTTQTIFENGTGIVTQIRYPSGRAVDYIYTTDKRAPETVRIRIDPNGINTFNYIASAITVDVEGRPEKWTWAQLPSTTFHEITRDMLGRITQIRDVGAGVDKATTTLSYDPIKGRDGDPSGVGNGGTLASTLSTAGTVPQSIQYGYNSATYPDALTTWSFDGTGHFLTLADSGTRTQDYAGGVTYPYTYAYTDENITLVNATGANPLDIDIDQSTLSEVTLVDFGNDASIELSSIAYGPRGDVSSMQVGSSSWSHFRDDGMRRWRRVSGAQSTTERWGAGDRILDISYSFYNPPFFNLWTRDEYIYLGDTPIGVTHADQTNTTPTTFFLSPDQMGTPRRVLGRTTSLTQTSRLVMDVWGDGTQMPTGNGIPLLPFRYPGQRQDFESQLVENQWRMYLPELGVYLSPDPEYRSSISRGSGPKAFAYASGRPLVNTDPTGQYDTADDAASGAARFIRLFTNDHMNVQEFSTWITCNGECGEYELVNWVPGPMLSVMSMMAHVAPGPKPEGAVAHVHNHPLWITQLGGSLQQVPYGYPTVPDDTSVWSSAGVDGYIITRQGPSGVPATASVVWFYKKQFGAYGLDKTWIVQ